MQKTTRYQRKDILFVILIILFVVIHACKLGIVSAETEEKRSVSGKLLVLPFHNMSGLYGKDKTVRCPICRKVFLTGEVPDKASGYLSDKLVLSLRKHKYYNKMVISDSQWGDFDLMSKNNKSSSELELLMAAGRAASADAVIVGYLYRFQQRVGSRISVDTPASVAFGIHLIDVKTGSRLWKGHFDETQGALSENLFKISEFIKRKGSWVTAEEMAVSGLKDVLETLP